MLGKRKGAAVAGGGLAAVVALALPMVQLWEGRSLVAYRDVVGVATICDGETRGVQMGDRATPAECDAMTAAAVAEFEAAIRPCLPAELPTKTRAAFVVTAYNIGSAGFCGSSMSRRALAGDLRGACDAISLYNKGTFTEAAAKRKMAAGEDCTRKPGGGWLCTIGGLTNRRAAEGKLCLEGLG